MNLSTPDIPYAISYTYGKLRSYLQPYINTKFDINKVCDGLYIGDFASACNREELHKLGITHIVTVITGVDEMFPSDFKYHLISIRDVPSTDIKMYFDDCVNFIDQSIIKGGKVFVHCMCGISRSVTIVSAYLIYKYGYDPNVAIEIVKSYRSCANPNEGFRNQLKVWDASNKPYRSV
jgi:hypothetical protein